MPPRLPRLVLFTGGPSCSLCEVAKADLAAVHRSTPFDLTLYDIRRPQNYDPSTLAESDRTVWRRLYQYDIPVLHRAEGTDFESLSGRIGGGGRVMKHRIDKEALEVLVRKWTAEMNDGTQTDVSFRSTFKHAPNI